MQTYSEKSTQLALDASVAVLVLCNPSCTDIEMLMVKPHPRAESELAQLERHWHGRNLRSIGIVGLVGTTPKCALKEPLEPEVTSRLADAFLAYLHTLLCDSFAVQMEKELERIWSLPDHRAQV